MYEVHSTLILSYDTVRHCLRHGQIIGQASLLHANKDIITVNRALSIGRCKSPSLCYVGVYHISPPTYLLLACFVDTLMPMQCVHEYSKSNPTTIPYCLQETGKESGNTTLYSCIKMLYYCISAGIALVHIFAHLTPSCTTPPVQQTVIAVVALAEV